MTHIKTLMAIMAISFGSSITANAQLFGGLDNNTILGGGAGAGLGALVGSGIAPRGNRTEGAAIGALVGGLGGAAYGNQQSQFAGNPFAGQFNPGFNGRNLLGTGTGAVIGGAIGSNIAGSGQRQEGTAIGAVLGGAAGYALANRGQNQQQFGGQQFGGQQFGGQPVYAGQQFGQPVGYTPQPVYSGQQFTQAVGYNSQPNVYSGQPVAYNPQTVYSGQTVTQTYQGPPTHYVQQQVQYVPDVTIAAPNLRLAGPPIREQVIYSNRVHVEHMPIARAQHYVAPARTVYQSAHVPTTTYTVQQPSYQQPSYQQPVQHRVIQPTPPSTLCYAGSEKRYDSWGNEIKTSSCSR